VSQHAKKVVSDSPGLVDFAIRLVNSVLTLPDGQVKYFEEFNLQNCEITSAHQKFGGLVELTFGLVNASFSFPEWQAVKMTFFAPCVHISKVDFIRESVHYWARKKCPLSTTMGVSIKQIEF